MGQRKKSRDKLSSSNGRNYSHKTSRHQGRQKRSLTSTSRINSEEEATTLALRCTMFSLGLAMRGPGCWNRPLLTRREGDYSGRWKLSEDGVERTF